MTLSNRRYTSGKKGVLSGVQAQLQLSFLVHLFSSSCGFEQAALFIGVLCVFPTHLLHFPACIDRGELPGIAV